MLSARVYDPSEKAPVAWRVRFINDTPEELQCDGVAPPCGCVGFDWDSSKLLPRGHSELTVTAKTDGQAVNRTFDVAVTAATGSAWRYRFHASASPKILFSPAETILPVPATDGEQRARLTVILAAPHAEALPRLLRVTASHPHVSATFTEEAVITQTSGVARREIPVNIAIASADFARGAHSEKLTFHLDHADSDQPVSFEHTVRFHLPSAFSVSPPRIFLGRRGDRSGLVDTQVSIARKDGRDIRLRASPPTHPAIAVSNLDSTRRGATFLVSVDLESTSATLYSEFAIETDDPAEPTLRIPVVALP